MPTIKTATKKESFINISINISKRILSLLDTLVALGEYPSRSEAIRRCLEDWTEGKLKNVKIIDGLLKMARPRLDDMSVVAENAAKLKRAQKSIEAYTLVSETIIDRTRVREYEKYAIDVSIEKKAIQHKAINEE